ncbi:MAG: VWA domain-containing protein [Planctomycetaceae bacterium]|jgi:hypothetical protein|nr:VWA domain-containing protein [Planctomycetaceae bacterium]MBT6155151.1 VWA domain-containing protein [Planctomycetaceae bacterium]MBT6493872.1 VWA domain-containing protein [Planctomycetaceae bacterium]
MSFLAPLFIAGLAAVSLPVLFHMIRRTPRGRIPFSTVMFFDPSPPQITRRSRLDNWPLLLLRALALILLAIAFARPFWRATTGANVAVNDGRQIAILLDSSASMRRGKIWNDAVARAERIVDDATPVDRIGLFTFDRTLKQVVGFEESSSLEPAARKKLLHQRLAETKPGWAATDLGEALQYVAETLVATDVKTTDQQSGKSKEIVLISDMQVGSQTRPLGRSQWPADVKLSVERVKPSSTTNAGLQLARSAAARPTEEDKIRVRVVNAANSTREQFQLRWQGDGPFYSTEQTIDVYVPPGSSRIVRVPFDPNLSSPAKLVLTGDDHDFDNSISVDRTTVQNLNVLYVGSDTASDPDGLRFYIERAFPDNGLRRVTVIGQPPGAPAISPDTHNVGLVVVAEPLLEKQFDWLRRHAEEGGTLLFVASSADVYQSFGKLIGKPDLKVREADVAGYAMLGDIDFAHPLFASFDDPRFADFTSIHFWKYRQIDGDKLADCRVLARFDDGTPAVVTKQLGRGSATLFASGWHPADSQLALSTKFVPLMNGLLELNAGRLDRQRHYTVGDAIPIAARANESATPSVVHGPESQTIQLTSGQRTFTDTVVPGVYRLGDAPDVPRFTVGLAASESRTAPMPVEKLEALGIPLKPTETPATKAAAAQRERQLKAVELEGRQKIWRWLILAAIVALMAETWLAGRTTKQIAIGHAEGAES